MDIVRLSEDIGQADPQAIVQAAATAQVTQLIGLPESLRGRVFVQPDEAG